ncbi:cyanophycinase [Aquabacterium sp. A7-Y]|uniref:cyanophycinase n=1 Tax=Aquabacterium sp. A7-Y TaxID=1349605 RepID=UPI00223D0286|nr:cyanophycinase [Aquabacterium sp. A7-Y]MCW7540818.1 cyanophycinase [Aquabacterium sp. A7-Y]
MSPQQEPQAQASHPGRLVIIGGAEDREQDKPILKRFTELASAGEGSVLVITAASTEPEEMWKTYRDAFGELGVRHCEPLHIRSRDEANDPAMSEKMRQAGGVFMTGGDQKRLLSLIGGTEVCKTMRTRYAQAGLCVAGTSAGASALSEHMLTMTGSAHPERDPPCLGVGLGFIGDAVIDQHFSERGRLGRLLAAIAHNPKLIGVGIDENTALIVHGGQGIEIVGEGGVTLMDGRDMSFDFLETAQGDVIQLADVRVHVLPAGTRHELNPEEGTQRAAGLNVPPRVRDLVRAICNVV